MGKPVDMHFFGRDKAPLRCAHKRRRNGRGFLGLQHLLERNDVVFLKREEGDEPLVAMTYSTWDRLLKW